MRREQLLSLVLRLLRLVDYGDNASLDVWKYWQSLEERAGRHTSVLCSIVLVEGAATTCVRADI